MLTLAEQMIPKVVRKGATFLSLPLTRLPSQPTGPPSKQAPPALASGLLWSNSSAVSCLILPPGVGDPRQRAQLGEETKGPAFQRDTQHTAPGQHPGPSPGARGSSPAETHVGVK